MDSRRWTIAVSPLAGGVVGVGADALIAPLNTTNTEIRHRQTISSTLGQFIGIAFPEEVFDGSGADGNLGGVEGFVLGGKEGGVDPRSGQGDDPERNGGEEPFRVFEEVGLPDDEAEGSEDCPAAEFSGDDFDEERDDESNKPDDESCPDERVEELIEVVGESGCGGKDSGVSVRLRSVRTVGGHVASAK